MALGRTHALVTDQKGPYTNSWRRYSRWYAASIGMFIGYLPVFALIAGLFPAVLESWLVFPMFALYALTWVYVSNVARRWPCPRCGEHFFGTLWLPQRPMFLVRSCRSCELPKYAASDPDPPTMAFRTRA